MTKPLKIGIYVLCFPEPSETFIVNKVLKMLEGGIDVHIFSHEPSPHWNHFESLQAKQLAKRVHYCLPHKSWWKAVFFGVPGILEKMIPHPQAFMKFMSHNWKTRKENSLGFWRGVYFRLPFVGVPLDLLHVEFDGQGLLVADIKDYLGCKLLLSARGTWQMTGVPDRFPDAPSRLFKRADGYHFISRFLMENTRRLGLSPKIPTWLIPPAVHAGAFKPQSRRFRNSQDPFQILSVGRLSWEKGYEFALDAVAVLRQKGVKLKYTILGEGPYREAVRFAAFQHGLIQDGTVHFEGAVPYEKMKNYYEHSDVLLHAALAEGFCNAALEAQAMGLPVVTSDAGGLPENVENNVTGFIVPRRDPEALAEKLLLLAQNPSLGERMGRAGRERAVKSFNLEDQTQKFLRLYHDLAGSNLTN